MRIKEVGCELGKRRLGQHGWRNVAAFVLSSSLFCALFACDSSTSAEQSPFDILIPTWCEAAAERDGAGVYSQLRHLSFDQEGNWTQTDWDYGNDGSINARTWREYENGSVVLHTFDVNILDEAISYRITWERDSDGNILRYSADQNGDGTNDFLRMNVWDGDQLVRSDFDRENDGIVDDYELFTYENSLLVSSKGYIGNGNTDEEPYYQQDRVYDGRLLRTIIGNWDNGASSLKEYEYDSQERLIFRKDTRGAEIETQIYSYDAQRRLSDHKHTSSGGTFHLFFNYECEERPSEKAPLPRSALNIETGTYQSAEIGSGTGGISTR